MRKATAKKIADECWQNALAHHLVREPAFLGLMTNPPPAQVFKFAKIWVVSVHLPRRYLHFNGFQVSIKSFVLNHKSLGIANQFPRRPGTGRGSRERRFAYRLCNERKTSWRGHTRGHLLSWTARSSLHRTMRLPVTFADQSSNTSKSVCTAATQFMPSMILSII